MMNNNYEETFYKILKMIDQLEGKFMWDYHLQPISRMIEIFSTRYPHTEDFDLCCKILRYNFFKKENSCE